MWRLDLIREHLKGSVNIIMPNQGNKHSFKKSNDII